MRLQGTAQRLTILVDEADHWHHRPVYVEIIHRAHHEGMAGATAIRGIEGFALMSPIHRAHLFALTEHMPIVIYLVDTHERIRTFLDSIHDVLHKGVALLDDVEVIGYRRG